MRVKGVVSLPLIPDPEVSYLPWFPRLHTGASLLVLSPAPRTPQQCCPRAQLSPGQRRCCGEAAPLQVSRCKGFSSERGNSQSSLKRSFSVVWGSHLHKCVFCCSFVSSLGFIMKLICLECSQKYICQYPDHTCPNDDLTSIFCFSVYHILHCLS